MFHAPDHQVISACLWPGATWSLSFRCCLLGHQRPFCHGIHCPFLCPHVLELYAVLTGTFFADTLLFLSLHDPIHAYSSPLSNILFPWVPNRQHLAGITVFHEQSFRAYVYACKTRLYIPVPNWILISHNTSQCRSELLGCPSWSSTHPFSRQFFFFPVPGFHHLCNFVKVSPSIPTSPLKNFLGPLTLCLSHSVVHLQNALTVQYFILFSLQCC